MLRPERENKRTESDRKKTDLRWVDNRKLLSG